MKWIDVTTRQFPRNLLFFTKITQRPSSPDRRRFLQRIAPSYVATKSFLMKHTYSDAIANLLEPFLDQVCPVGGWGGGAVSDLISIKSEVTLAVFHPSSLALRLRAV